MSRAAYSQDERLSVLDLLQASADDSDRGVPAWSSVARSTGTSRQTLRRWWKQRDELRQRQPIDADGGRLVVFPGSAGEADAPPADGTRERWLWDIRQARRGALARESFTAVATLLRLEGESQGWTTPPKQRDLDPLHEMSDDELRAIVDGERASG